MVVLIILHIITIHNKSDDYSCINVLYGCVDVNSMNYNYLANTDDGSCIYPIEGCTDFSAINYNSDANIADGSCEYSIGGCINDLYLGMIMMPIFLMDLAKH